MRQGDDGSASCLAKVILIAPKASKLSNYRLFRDDGHVAFSTASLLKLCSSISGSIAPAEHHVLVSARGHDNRSGTNESKLSFIRFASK